MLSCESPHKITDLRSLVVAPQLFSSGDNSSSGNNSIDTVVPVAALNRLLLPLQ